MKNKISLVILIMTVILFITSCIEVQYSIKINDDSSQRIGVKIIMPVMFSVQSGEIIKKLSDEGYSASTNTEGDKFIVEGTKTTEKEAWLFPFPNMASNVTFEPSVKNYIFFKTFTFNGKYSLENKDRPDPNSPFASMAIPLKYSVEMPGSVNFHNAGQFSGNILQWQYNMAERQINVDVQASSYTVNYFAIIAFVVVTLVLIAITILRPAYKKYSITILLAILIAVPALIFLINIDDKVPAATQIQTQKPNQTQSSNAIVPNPAPAPLHTKNEDTTARFGSLTINDDKMLLYNGRPLNPVITGNNSLDIVEKYDLGSAEVILIQDTGGTACPAQYYFVNLSASGAQATPAFGTCSDLIKVTRKESSILVSMPGFMGPFESEKARTKAAKEKHLFIFEKGIVTENGIRVK